MLPFKSKASSTMLMPMRWADRRSLPCFCMLVATMTITLMLYCWVTPYPVAVEHMSIMTGVERNLFAKHAINNTVIIVPINTGMVTLADNLLCSLSATTFDVKKIIFWALDDGAEEIFDKRGFATIRDASLFGVSQDVNHRGDTSEYRRMMKERPKFFADFLSTGYDMLMIDADTVFWQSPEVLIPDRNTVDIVYSTDAREFYQVKNAFKDIWRRGSVLPPVCNGLFWMKARRKNIQLWRDMLDVFESGWRTLIFRLIRFQDDQRGADYLLNDGRAQLVPPYPDGIDGSMVPDTGVLDDDSIRVRLLDQTQVVNGHLLRNRHSQYDKYLKKLRQSGKDRIVAHFNWASKDQTKIGGAKDFGMYFLDDNGKCMLKQQ